jgi:hypothetical protein
MSVPCINSIKALLLFHKDAHNHKTTGILKQLKFRRLLRHVSVHVGTIIREPFLCLAKTTVMILHPRRSWRGQCHGSIPACCAGVWCTASWIKTHYTRLLLNTNFLICNYWWERPAVFNFQPVLLPTFLLLYPLRALTSNICFSFPTVD